MLDVLEDVFANANLVKTILFKAVDLLILLMIKLRNSFPITHGINNLIQLSFLIIVWIQQLNLILKVNEEVLVHQFPHVLVVIKVKMNLLYLYFRILNFLKDILVLILSDHPCSIVYLVIIVMNMVG